MRSGCAQDVPHVAQSSFRSSVWTGRRAHAAAVDHGVSSGGDAKEITPEVQEAWAAEVDRRQTEVENGTVNLLSGPESLAELKAEFE